MDKLVEERKNKIEAPRTVKEYLEQKKVVYENKGPTYLNPLTSRDPKQKKEDKDDFETGVGGKALTSALAEIMKWNEDKLHDQNGKIIE